MKKLREKLNSLSLQVKLVLVFILTSVIIFVVNLFVYINLNIMVKNMEDIYSTNVTINEMSENLDLLQDSLLGYLKTKGTDELEQYYRCVQKVNDQIGGLNDRASSNQLRLMEKNIRGLSEQYLITAADAVQAKRGRNTQKYTEKYEECERLHSYLSNYLYCMNTEQFRTDYVSYAALLVSFRNSEFICIFILVVIAIMNLFIIILMTRNITNPLTLLAAKADEIAGGELEKVEPLEIYFEDEVGTVTRAFNQMLNSIKQYIVSMREQMEIQSDMKAKSLMMEAHLKDAQLKYLQAQINPHFLFNTLNAGAQLAMMEGADRTNEYIQHMADFFRYNVKKNNDVVTIEEEISLVDSYIYILNVRFSGEIRFSKEIDESLLKVRIPAMIIQPLVENAVNYGIRNIDREGHITLSLYEDEGYAAIRVSDNGIGISGEKIELIMSEEPMEPVGADSNGVGIRNVKSRLSLFYEGKNTFEILSEGQDLGTEVLIRVPLETE